MDNLNSSNVVFADKNDVAITSLWNIVLSTLERETMSLSFNTFIKPLVPFGIEGENFIVIAVDVVAKKYVEHRHLLAIEKVLSENHEHHLYLKVMTIEELDEPLGGSQQAHKKDDENETNIKPKYVFDNFIKGKSNEFAFAACVAVADAPGETTYNPLFIYGGAGLGKTHLMHSIGNHVLKQNNKLKILYTTSENLTNEFITSIREHKNQQFRDKFRNLDILMIDDIQFLGNKEGTQEEFFHTFNELYFDGKQIIIASDKPPIELKTLEERLRTRFGSGLIVDITQPDFETRVAILEKKAELERMDVPRDVLHLIANSITSNIREMEGGLTKVIAKAKLIKEKITIELAENALKDMVEESKERKITPLLITEIVGSYHDISVEELLSKKRSAPIAATRHLTMFLMRKIMDVTFVDIGKFFDRHHSSVVHAVNQVEFQFGKDEGFKKKLIDLENRIKGN